MSDDVQRKRVAILSADAANYSGLMAADEVATVRTIAKLRSEIAARVHQHRGRVVDAPGDNVLAEFPSVINAVASALHLQQSIARHNASLPEAQRMRFRVGIHVGSVIVDDDRIYGDSVNIAARLQQLAEPGGLMVSRSVAERLSGDQPFEVRYVGPKRLKNIPEPVTCYRVHDREADPSLSDGGPSLPYGRELSVPGFSGQPAIAVLPFELLDGGTDDDFFARGLTDDLVTRLSALRAYPVLTAGASTGASSGSLRSELRSRYAVKGAVRRTAGRVRINVQLIDTDSSQVVWADQYDQTLGELFELQDSITTSVAAIVEPTLRRVEQRRALYLHPSELSAWECVQRGQWHMVQLRRETNLEAQTSFRRAIELDPNFATAHAFLGISLAFDSMFAWSKSPRLALDEAIRAAETGLALDDQNPFVHRALGGVYVIEGKLRRSIDANRKAIELSPSYALGYWGAGQQLALAGRPNEGLAMLRTAMRLSPNDPITVQFLADLCIAYFGAERYEEAVDAAERSLALRTESNWCWPFMLAALVHLDRIADARRTFDRAPPLLKGLSGHGMLRVLERMGADRDLISRLSIGMQAAMPNT